MSVKCYRLRFLSDQIHVWILNHASLLDRYTTNTEQKTPTHVSGVHACAFNKDDEGGVNKRSSKREGGGGFRLVGGWNLRIPDYPYSINSSKPTRQHYRELIYEPSQLGNNTRALISNSEGNRHASRCMFPSGGPKTHQSEIFPK